jgi:hypothetical protein
MNDEVTGKLYHSVEEYNEDMQYNTIHAARHNGFDMTQDGDNGHVLCGKHATAELVDVFPDGSWEYQNREDDEVDRMTGVSSVMLHYFLNNKELYKEIYAS